MVENPLIDEKNIKAAVDSAAFFLCSDAEQGFISALSEANRHRLVKGSKSPTDYQGPLNTAIFQRLALQNKDTYPIEIEKLGEARNIEGQGAFTMIGFREYSGEYRIRTEVQGTIKQEPPENTGDRVTEMLTNRGARKIAESCEFMSIKRKGYSTFLTLTLKPEARTRVELGETTIQKEVSRFFDGLQKMYQRGFDCEIEGEIKSFKGSPVVNGSSERLDYLWVAECPDKIEKETGEITGINPHVHVLMRYRVPFIFFDAWAKRVESLWGQGTAHLEKIKDGSKAGAYMAKAAGYLCKAQGKSDQGTIKGNRYNISKTARAPDWVCVGRYQLGRMGFLISEAAEVFDEKFGYVKKKRDGLKRKLEKAVGPERHKIGAILEKTRTQLQKMPRLSKYQAILKGEDQFNEFMAWACNDESVSNHKWLPEKAANEGFLTVKGKGHWLYEYTHRRAIRRQKRKWGAWFEHERALSDYMFSEVASGFISLDDVCENDDFDDFEFNEVMGCVA